MLSSSTPATLERVYIFVQRCIRIFLLLVLQLPFLLLQHSDAIRGLFNVSYYETMAGPWNLSVSVNGQEIMGSPFSAPILPGPPRWASAYS